MGRRKKTTAEYITELEAANIVHRPLEEYTGYNIKINHICPMGHVFSIRPGDILNGIGCKTCSAKKQSRTTSEYNDLIANRGIVSLEEYITAKVPIRHRCSCSYEWSVAPHDILAGHRCPICNKPKGGYNITRFENDPELANSPGICYLVVLVDKDTNTKVAYKIGITKGTSDKDVLKRLVQFKVYEARILKTVKGTLLEVFTLEQALHKKWKHLSLIPDKKFGGYLECFELNNDIVRSFPRV